MNKNWIGGNKGDIVKTDDMNKVNEEKPSWLSTAQKIYPMSDDRYYKMFEAAKRSAKIELNRCNGFTPPNYQRRYERSAGESLVIDAAKALRHCQFVLEKLEIEKK